MKCFIIDFALALALTTIKALSNPTTEYFLDSTATNLTSIDAKIQQSIDSISERFDTAFLVQINTSALTNETLEIKLADKVYSFRRDGIEPYKWLSWYGSTADRSASIDVRLEQASYGRGILILNRQMMAILPLTKEIALIGGSRPIDPGPFRLHANSPA